MMVIWLLMGMLGVVYGNLGFEYEVDVVAAGLRDWMDVIGLPEVKKPIGFGSNGWWEVQLDSTGSAYEIEVVFPPARTSSGMPDDSSYLQEELCLAFEEIGTFFSQMANELKQQFHSGKSVFDISIPGNLPPLKLPFIVARHEIPDFPLAGTLQATVGVPMVDFMQFIGKTLEDPGAGIYTHYDYMKEIYDAVISMSNISPSGQSLVYLLSTYYYLGNSVDTPADYIKSIASVMSRTSHSEMFLNLPDQDKQEFFRLSSASIDSWEARGQGLLQAIKIVIGMVLPDQEFSDVFVKSGFTGRFQGTSVSVSETCEKLGRGIDAFAEMCPSMGNKGFLPSREIVVEFRSIPVHESYHQAWSFAKDFFKFVVDFKADPESSKFTIGSGQDLCQPLPSPDPLEQSSWFSIETPLNLDDSLKPFYTGLSTGYRVLSGGHRQMWEFGVWDKRVFVHVPSFVKFPRGFAKDKETEKDIMMSMRMLNTQLIVLSKQFASQAKTENVKPMIIQPSLYGKIPPNHHKLLFSTFSSRFSLDIRSTLLLTLDNAFQIILQVFTVPAWDIPYHDIISDVISDINWMPLSNIGKLLILGICMNVVRLKPNPIEINHDLNSLYQMLTPEDEKELDSYSTFTSPSQDAHHKILFSLEYVVKQVFPELDENDQVSRILWDSVFNTDISDPHVEAAMKSAGPSRVYVDIRGICHDAHKTVGIIQRVRSMIKVDNPLLATGKNLLS